MPRKFLIEGLDALGKTTLIKGICNKLGYFQVIHYSKPERLTFYDAEVVVNGDFSHANQALEFYQRDCFDTMFKLLKSDANIILDRAHLGECVYSPIYRGYSGDFVFSLEQHHGIHLQRDIRMILLAEDFTVSRHFQDDGQSFDVSKRQEEQELFIEAFNKSNIIDKRIVYVTDHDGNFKNKNSILQEVLGNN